MQTILIVDDEADAIEFVEAMLAQAGDFKILTASDGDAAIEQVKAGKPDLVLLDVQMPGKSGFDVFRAIREDAAAESTKVIMVTGVADKAGISFSGAEMGEFLGSKPDAYIEKPVDPELLKKTVKEVLGL